MNGIESAARAARGSIRRRSRSAAFVFGALILASCRSLPREACGPLPGRHHPAAARLEGCGCEPAVAACPQPRPCPPPVVGPWYVCDGGDAGAPAAAEGESGLVRLTAGDTVARYQPADAGPDAGCVHLATTNCACVYAPRFSAVREVVRLAEESADRGPNGLALDRLVGQQVDLLPILAQTQQVAPSGARNALPGVALEERRGPQGVDQAAQVHEDDGRERAAAGIADLGPEQTERTAAPQLAVSFVVPLAWTSLRSAQVLANDQEAQVVAADRGTATLRLESPGRAELTLCKRAGSDTARSGEELDFMIYLLNSGDRPLAGIVLADALPARLELVPGSAAASLPAEISTASGDDGSVVVRWRFTTTLEPGAGGFVRFRAIVR